ncbi:MAG TPA: YdjY domain-containing protein [Luteolibacter sp.]|nr:YdjY domain-containing protein [Luteolibacter sp.]
MRFLRPLVLLAACLTAAFAQEAAEVKPSVEKLDDTRYKIGTITFDSKTREIRFPASVNMNKDLLEFLIVHKNGKVHESLLKTEISATDLNVAFNLLRYKPSAELYAEPSSPDDPTAKFPAVPDEVKEAARIKIEVEWKDGENLRKVPINEWVQHASTGSAMPAGPWVYGGSEITDGKFQAETTGDIAAIYLSRSALINYPGKDNQDDTVWFVYPKRVPALDSPVTVIISPFPSEKP